jgi:hypothetical protein
MMIRLRDALRNVGFLVVFFLPAFVGGPVV